MTMVQKNTYQELIFVLRRRLWTHITVVSWFEVFLHWKKSGSNYPGVPGPFASMLVGVHEVEVW